MDPRTVLQPSAILERKQPSGDAFDRLRVLGYADYDGGALTEVVVAPVDFGSPFPVALEALDAAYIVVEEGQRPREWATDPLDVALRRDSTLQDPNGAARVLAESRPGRATDEPLAPSVEAYRMYKESQ